MFNTIILITILFSLLLEGLVDSSKYKYDIKVYAKQTLTHFWQVLFILSFFIGLGISYIVKVDNATYQELGLILAGYTLIRFGIFDWVVNIFCNRHWLHIGENSVYDITLKKLFKGNGMLLLIVLKMLSLIFGLYIIQRIL